MLELRAASIMQMALGRVGGILEAKKIAAMAEAHYAQVAPHLYCGPVEGAANVQLSACIPNFLILESIGTWSGFHADILKKPMRWEDGYVIVPDAPGLGVELDEEVALAHPIPGTTCISCRASGRSASPTEAGSNNLMRYAYIGLGNLGANLAACLRRAGFSLVVHDRDIDRRRPAAGARRRPGPAARARPPSRPMPSSPACLRPTCPRQVLTGPDGVLGGLRAGGTWIEMSTLDRDTILRACPNRRRQGRRDAGSARDRRRASGGDRLGHRDRRRRRRRCSTAHKPALEAMGKLILHMGPLGSAAVMKVITNMLAFIHLVAAGEALMLAKRGGLDLAQAFQVIKRQFRQQFCA